jgi:hypothetical protein
MDSSRPFRAVVKSAPGTRQKSFVWILTRVPAVFHGISVADVPPSFEFATAVGPEGNQGVCGFDAIEFLKLTGDEALKIFMMSDVRPAKETKKTPQAGCQIPFGAGDSVGATRQRHVRQFLSRLVRHQAPCRARCAVTLASTRESCERGP